MIENESENLSKKDLLKFLFYFQCRLHSCGLPSVIYLFEDCGSKQHFSIPEESLMQAIRNTQVKTGSRPYLEILIYFINDSIVFSFGRLKHLKCQIFEMLSNT